MADNKIQDKRKRLYDGLVAAGYDAGAGFEDFNNLMDTDEVARQWVYDTAKSEGWKVGDSFEQFVGYITPQQGESAGSLRTALENLSGIPYPQKKVDKSQYTFTSSQLGIEEPKPVVSGKGVRGLDLSGIERPYTQPQRGAIDEAVENVNRYQRMRYGDGGTLVATGVYKDGDVYRTAGGTAKKLTNANYKAYKAQVESDITDMMALYEQIGATPYGQLDTSEWGKYVDAMELGGEGRSRGARRKQEWQNRMRENYFLPARELPAEKSIAKPQGYSAALRLLPILSLPEEEGKKILGEEGYNALKFFKAYNERFAQFNNEAEEDAARLGFAETMAQGFESMGRGAEYFLGESYNAFSGSGLDDKAIIDNWDEFFTEDGKLKSAPQMGFAGTNELENRNINLKAGYPEVYKDYRDYIQGLLAENGNDIDKVKKIIKDRSKDATFGDRLIMDADNAMNSFNPEMEGALSLVAKTAPQMVGVLAAIVSGGAGAPALGSAIGVGNMGYLTASTMGQSMKEARDAGATNLETWLTGIADGAIELVTEKIPFDNWTKGILRTGKGKIAGELVESMTKSPTAREEFELLLKRSRKELDIPAFSGNNIKKYLAGVAAEGASEFTAEALQTLTKRIYENPEDYPTIMEAIKNGWEGAKAGLLMGAVTGAVVTSQQRRANDARRKKQGFVEVASLEIDGKPYIGEIVGKTNDGGWVVTINGEDKVVKSGDIKDKVTFSYEEFRTGEIMHERQMAFDEGYSQEPTGEAAVNNNGALEAAENEVRRMLGLANDADIDAEVAKFELTDEEAKAVDNYRKAKARFEGIQQRFQEMRDAQYAESDRRIDERSNKRNPAMVYSTMYDGQQVYITDGDVVLNEDGTIDYNNSSEALYITYPDGHAEQVSVYEFIEKVNAGNTEELKAQGRAQIDQNWKNEFDTAEISAAEQEKRKKGLLFNLTDGVGAHTIEVLEEGADDSKILFDGKEMSISTDELNQWRQEAGVQREVAPVQSSAPAVAPIPIEKRGKEERAAYHLAPIERTLEDLHDGALEPNEITALINARIKEAYNDVQALEKKKPTEPKKPVMGASKEAYLVAKAKAKADYEKAQAEWQTSMDEAQQRLNYYNELYAREQEITKSETREAYDNVQPREVVEMTADEFIANNLPKITPESFKAETGLSNSEQAELVGYIAGADKGGVSVERAAEIIMESYGDELRELGFQGDMQDVRNTIIDILSQGNPRSYAKSGIEQRRKDSINQQRAEMESVAASLGFESVEEWATYEEQVIPGIIQMYTGFDYNEYYNNLAENYEYDTTREGETVGRGGELLQGEQPVDNTGAPVAEGNEGGAVSDSVQSDGANAQASGNQQVNEPVGNSEQLSSSEIPNNQSVTEGGASGQSGVYADNQGNPVDADGKLIVDEVNSIDEITDEDFETPTRNVQLPAIPENVANAIGTDGRPVVIKKNVFEKNGNTHVELEPEDSRNILRSALYNPNLVGSTQPIRRPDYKVAIRTGEQNAVVVLDVYREKDYVEIVGWRMVNEKGLAKMQRQAEREGGQFLILSPNDGAAAALSALPFGLSSESEDRNSVSNSQENAQESGEIAENGGEVTETTTEQTENENLQTEATQESDQVVESPAEASNAGPVNMDTLQLNMSDEDFNALLSSGDKAAISEYLAEMDGLLRVGVGSPLDGRDDIVKEYRGLVEQYGGEDNIPADVVAGINERIAPYNALQRAIFDRKYALQDRLREIEATEQRVKELAEKEAKAEHKQTAFGGFLAVKTDLGASAAEKALNKKYDFDGKVMTVAEFVEEAVGNGDAKLSTIEEPKYKGASRAAWNRMDARQQEADAKRVKESGTKMVYTVNDHDLGKTAYDYAKFLLDKKAEQEKAAAKQMVKNLIQPFAKEKAAEQAAVKIEDVGEKIGGARKDIIRQYADKIKLDGKTFSTMFPKPDIDKLIEAGLPKDKVAAVKAMYDNAKREYEIAKKRRGKDKALQASLFYAMYAKNVLTGEEGNFDLAYNGFVFTEWGKEFMKANIALYKAVFNKLGTDYGKVDLRSYFITPLAAGMREYFNLKKLNEENSRMQQRMAEMDGRKVPEYKDGDVINFVGEHYSRPSDQFETLEEAVNTMVERISKEVKVDEAAQYKVESYWKRDAQGRADYTKAYLGIKVRGFGTVDVMEFKNMNEANTWLQNHREDFQQMAAAKEEQVKAENKKPLPKYIIGNSYDSAKSQYFVFADFGKEGVKILKTFNIPQAEGVAAQAKARSEVYKNDVLPYMNSEEALSLANGFAQEIRDAKSAKQKPVTVEKKSRERVGVDWRNGKNATPDMFVDIEGNKPSVFGFRAVEFGNYVTQKERQQYLNDLYDALMDMSELLGVSPRALSLGGKLALAVGARGTSGASGHYEPYKNVINITKTSGAGVLAHEWLHAFDRYFSNFDENAVYPNGVMYATQGMFADNTRKEVKEAFERVMTAIKGSDYEKRSMRLGEYWASDKELAARALQDYIIRKLDDRGQKNDFLSNHVAPEEWDGDAKGYPFPLGEDAKRIADAFDNLFATLEEKTTEDGNVVLYRSSEDIEAEYPNWLEGTTTDSGKHSTQVEGTRKTYKKVADWIEENMGKDVAILDASSGMGYGTADLRERGFDIEDVEPYQSEDRKQNNPATYSSYADIEKQYDYIISNAVLNVIPDNWRTDLLHEMVDKLKVGGKLFINTRKAGEERSIKDKIELDSPQEVLVKRNGKIASYQRFFTPTELKEWIESELGEGYSVEIANKANSGTNGLAAVVVTKNEQEVEFDREGAGPLTDREVVMESDLYSKVLGKPRYYGQKQRNYVARQRAKMAQKATELAEKLNTPIEVRETAEGLTGKKAKAKGWYDVKSGNVVVVVSNHGSIEDIQATVLHEVVAHKGLRQMFGEHFDAFLDNVYNNVDAEIRAKIDALTEKYGNTREATEEYLASLAENTYFEKVNPSLWSRIKQWFLNMLTEAGIKLDFELSDNELRYILWRSHQRLINPSIYNPVTRITDVAVRARLGIGEYAPAVEEMAHVAEEDAAEYANKNQDIFVSNAQRAVEGIKQEKATPEQWIAMLKKNGGLKAGENAWLGLEEWLNEKQGAVTKQEILDFIGENKIQIEEVEYEDLGKSIDYELAAVEGNLERARRDLAYEEAQVRIAEKWLQDSQEEYDSFLSTANRLKTEYGENSPEYRNYIFYDSYTDVLANAKRALENAKSDVEYRRQQIAELEKAVKEKQNQKTRGINRTRLDYTTVGLENKREIALTVPTIEQYNASDEVHFGDAGNGRAVAWVRFGETTDSEGNRVLVIDEIQSKRHQDGREKGYKEVAERLKNTAVEAQRRRVNLAQKWMAAHPEYTQEQWEDFVASEEYQSAIKAVQETEDAAKQYPVGIVPSAPFEKNWHELAMKRMLRLAAEEGFNKVAWTTGEQQAQRYNLSNSVSRIDVELDGRKTPKNTNLYDVYTYDTQGDVIDAASGPMNEERLSEVFGKEIAISIAEGVQNSVNGKTSISGDGLRIGGEGMKGFYDKMLPSFVQKYTKKWGAKVGEVTMPSLEENNTMWSVDVTPEMQESVMQGQTMFRMGSRVDARMAEVAAHFEGKQLTAEQQAVVDVFSGKADNLTISVKTKDDNERRVVMRQGNEMGAGAKHSLFRHLGMNNGAITADDILLIPEILANGERVEKKRGKKTVIEYKYTDNNGVEYTVITENNKGREEFANFYTNRKASSAARKTRSEEARDTADDASADKGSDNSSNTQEGEIRFRTVEKEKLSPEEKERQRKLKDNAKAIRRLHNVKANYPITALRNLGFALETQEQRDEHDRLFAERDAISGRQNAVSAEANPQSMTLMERITESLMKAAVQNKENVDMRLSAIRAYGRDLANVIKLMRAQRGYDRNTVNMFVSLAKMYLRNNAISGMSSYDISRLLGLISRANGGYGPQVMRAAEQIAEIITKSHTKELEDIVRKQIKTGAEKVNASGVVVQGGVDVVGKRVLNTFRDAINMTSEEEFEKAFREAFEKAAKFPNDVEAKAACDAMVIAKEYRDNIVEAKKQESELLKSINQYSDIRSRYDRGEITRREYNEFVDAVRKSLIELRSRMVDDYQRIIHALGGDISEGIKRAKEFRERELARVEKIHNMAEADMSGVSKSAERKKRGFWRKATDYVVFKNPLAKVIAEGLGTYNEFMKFFGRNAIGGKGRLYDYFIGRYTEVQNQEWVEKQKDIKKIDERCEMVFGKGFKDVMRDSEKNSGVVLEYWNGGERVSRDLSIGQLMYIYMTAKQTDGEMKLRGMGITEETVNKAVAVLPARYKAFADWVQSDFLPEMRPRLNEVHKRMFGASMSEVKNYFPLVVNTDARQAEVDLNSVMPITPSTITGSIIKRKVNATPLNLESNAFDVLLNHVSDMEHWAAFAEFTRDNNTLIGDKDFMNRVKNSRDLRFGDGEAIWNNFVETARITTGNYRAKKDEWANVMKGVSSAKITFGYYTALKQFLSSPALWLEAGAVSIIKATVNPLGSWRWAKENLPGFEERWKGRTAGNERLADSDSDWSIWDNRIVKAAREVGMTPNAFVDAVVVSTGARAVYDSRKRFYKALGLSQEEQHKRALKDAAVAYNETQQSAQGAYLSILQKEGGFKAMVMTLYRNSQMAYSRKVTGSMAELYKKAVRWKDILDNEEKKYLEMGLSEKDAKEEANKALLKGACKDVATLVMFGYVLNMVWYLGEQLPYLLFGDDEEEKEKIMVTALKIGATGMFEGFALGNVAKDLYVKGVTGNRYSSDMLTTPFASDAEKIINRFANDGTLAGMSQLLILGAETVTGISPQRLIDDVAAVIDICNGDLDKATEVTLLTTRLAKVPQSQIDKLYLEEALGGDVVALAERYAEYKRLRDYPLNIGDDKILKKYAERFKKAHNEDLKEIVKDENAYEGYFSNASPEEKIKLAGYRGEYLEELTGKKAEEVLTGRELVYYTLYGRKEQNLVYSAMTTPDDVDDEICIEMMISELKPILDNYPDGRASVEYGERYSKELNLLGALKERERAVSQYKSDMKKNDNYADEYMTEIRKLRAEAIELINRYYNE